MNRPSLQTIGTSEPVGGSGGFDPLRRAVEVVNALAGTSDAEHQRAELTRVLLDHGERDVELNPDDVAGLRDAARALSQLLATPEVDRAARLINVLLARAAVPPYLSNHDGHSWHLHVTHLDAGWGDWLLVSGALALGELLTRRGYCPWGQCAAADCPHFYVHDGRGSTRRYCSARCATRERVAAYRRQDTTTNRPRTPDVQ